VFAVKSLAFRATFSSKSTATMSEKRVEPTSNAAVDAAVDVQEAQLRLPFWRFNKLVPPFFVPEAGS
jgi:hypothetical protein